MARSLEELLSVNTVPYEGIVFSPLEYKPITPDLNILQHSLGQIEERAEKAATHKAALNKALGEARLKVHQDEESLKWFDKFADDLTQGVESASERGDLGAAIQEAQLAAGELTNAPAYLGMIQNTARYEDEVKTQKARLDKGDISNEAFERWDAENTFNPNWIYDEKSGKVVGSKTWNSKYSPVGQADLYGIFAKIADGLSVRKESHAPGEATVDAEGNLVSHTSRSGELVALDRSKFIRDSKDAISTNTIYRNIAYSDFQDQIYYYEHHNTSNDSVEKAKCQMIYNSYYSSGQPDFNKYVDNLCNKYADDFSYIWDLRSSDTTVPKTTGSGSSTKNNGRQGTTTAGAGNKKGEGKGNNGPRTDNKRK